jgi:hypothetical protein
VVESRGKEGRGREGGGERGGRRDSTVPHTVLQCAYVISSPVVCVVVWRGVIWLFVCVMCCVLSACAIARICNGKCACAKAGRRGIGASQSSHLDSSALNSLPPIYAQLTPPPPPLLLLLLLLLARTCPRARSLSHTRTHAHTLLPLSRTLPCSLFTHAHNHHTTRTRMYTHTQMPACLPACLSWTPQTRHTASTPPPPAPTKTTHGGRGWSYRTDQHQKLDGT